MKVSSTVIISIISEDVLLLRDLEDSANMLMLKLQSATLTDSAAGQNVCFDTPYRPEVF